MEDGWRLRRLHGRRRGLRRRTDEGQLSVPDDLSAAADVVRAWIASTNTDVVHASVFPGSASPDGQPELRRPVEALPPGALVVCAEPPSSRDELRAMLEHFRDVCEVIFVRADAGRRYLTTPFFDDLLPATTLVAGIPFDEVVSGQER